MLVDLQDANLRARISCIAGDKYRLVLDYPRDPAYRDRVLSALSDLLRPAQNIEMQHNRRGPAQKTGNRAE